MLESAGERWAQQAEQRARSGGHVGDRSERLSRAPAGPRGVREPLEAPPPPGRAVASGGTAPRAHAARRRGPTRAVGAGRDGCLQGYARMCGAGGAVRGCPGAGSVRGSNRSGSQGTDPLEVTHRGEAWRGGVGAARGAEPPPRSAPIRGHARLPRTCSLRPRRARTLRSAAAPVSTGGGTTVRCPPRTRGGAGGGGVPWAAARRSRVPGRRGAERCAAPVPAPPLPADALRDETRQRLGVLRARLRRG